MIEASRQKKTTEEKGGKDKREPEEKSTQWENKALRVVQSTGATTETRGAAL